MTRNSSTQRAGGFTIVELIIIVIVIGILAAITVVSYAGITTNAKKQTVKTDALTAATALNRYKADNGAYPASFSALGEIESVESTYQYTYTAGTGTFCLTASMTGASAYVQSGNSQAKEGKCAGHS